MIEAIKNALLECKEYVDQLKMCPKGYFLYRGSSLQIGDIKLLESRLSSRRPQNMPDHLHDSVNEIFESQFGWKIRNGVFCYGFTSLNDVPENLGYGLQYLCFPVGHFSFVYSPQHFDLVGHFRELKYNITDDHIKDLTFKTDSLKEAIDSNKYRNGISNEISVNVQSYYLIDVKHRQDLADEVWQ